MSVEIEQKIEKIPIVRNIMYGAKKVKLPGLEGLTLYDLLEIYIVGIVEGAITYRAGAVAFSFFMALFPFALFILNLIPFIPIKGFEQDFLRFLEDSVPPNTYEAIASIINDILNNSYKGLLSSGFLLSIFLMANGLNAILGGFESSHHVIMKRGVLKQYLVALGMSVVLALLLLLTVAVTIVFEVFIQSIKLENIFNNSIHFIEIGRYGFLIIMILITSSVLLKYGTKETKNNSFISVGSIFTTVLIILSSYFFGIWVVKFSQYNELYGSIGTLLIMMFYIWLNCMILLLGFELNTSINRLRRRNLFK